MNYERILLEQVLEDERFIILTAENRAALRNLPEILKNKFIDTGITEQTMIGISAGLALRGRIPVVHALAAFLTMRAFEFIRTDIGISNLPVKLVGSFAGLLSEANGPTHQAIEDVALMRGIPNINVFCPADENDMLLGLPKILEYNKPFYIRYNNMKPDVEHTEFAMGQPEIFGDGREVAILVYGALFGQAYSAKQILESRGIEVKLINMRTLKPLNEETVVESIKNTTLIATIEDHFINGGLFTILSEIMAKNKLSADILPFAFKNKWFKPALLNDVLTFEGLTDVQLADKIEFYLITKRVKANA